MEIVDAHQHFWDPARVHYPWLAPSMPSLDRRFGFDDLRPHLAAVGVSSTVLVQSGDLEEDNEAMLEIAAGHGEIAGIVAWVPLDRPHEVARRLESLRQAGPVVGVRNLIHERRDADWLVSPPVLEGLGVLETVGLTFDVVAVLPRHLAHVPQLCERFPRLRLVIDHLAKPPIGSGDETAWRTWRAGIAEAARSPEVFAKVSGLYPAGSPAEWSVDDLRPAIETALAAFGPRRLMLGSDWPVCEIAGGYERVVAALLDVIGDLAPPDAGDILAGTARRCYGLGLPLGASCAGA